MAVYDCYHGTSKASADKIIKANRFKAKWQPNHWLGQGVYFFINDLTSAIKWAEHRKPPSQVISCEVSIKRVNLLDLDTIEDQNKFHKFIEAVRTAMVNNHVHFRGVEPRSLFLPIDNRRKFACAAIDMYTETHPLCYGIKCTFDNKGLPTHPTMKAMGFKPKSPQICVRRNFSKIISNIELVPID